MDVLSEFKKQVRSHIDAITPPDRPTGASGEDGSDEGDSEAGSFSDRFADSLDTVIEHAFADAERVEKLAHSGDATGRAEAVGHFSDTFAAVYRSALRRALDLEEAG